MFKFFVVASVAAVESTVGADNCMFQIAQFGNCFVGVTDANPPCNTNVDVTVLPSPGFSVKYIEANGATLYKHTDTCYANVTVSVTITDHTLVDFKCYHLECSKEL
jgi:hypothetical protein